MPDTKRAPIAFPFFGPLTVDAHIPHGSGDAGFRLVDTGTDNNDVVAIVDPNCTLDGLDRHAGDYADYMARAINTHDEAREALRLLEASARRLAKGKPCSPAFVIEKCDEARAILAKMDGKA